MRHALFVSTLCSAACLAACADPSIATRPRTVNPYAGLKEDDAAARRALEAPPRILPTGAGDAPRQLNQAPAVDGDRQVALLQASAGAAPDTAPPAPTPDGTSSHDIPAAPQPTGWGLIGHRVGPTNQYNRDFSTGPLPHLPPNPGAGGAGPMAGSTPVAGTGWSIDHSWGEVMPLTNYPHRAWPETTGHYETADVKHNPVYFYNVQEHLNVVQNNGSQLADWQSELYEVPWFYLNSLALPVLMVLEPPFAQRTTRVDGGDPNYHGYLPSGPTVATPPHGELRWEYPFLNADGSVIKADGATEPATRPAP